MPKRSDHHAKPSPAAPEDAVSASAETHPHELLTHPAYEELLHKLDEAEQKANQHWERILRMQAEADNAARRAERDVASAHKFALEKFANELLPIIDSLELCLKSVPTADHEQTAAVLEGVNLTLKLFYAAMEKFGIVQVNPIDSAMFDPEHHQAISLQTDTTLPAGSVLSVLQKGYTLNGRLLRPALVVVSKAE
jgi:molecular chaperone GrpE